MKPVKRRRRWTDEKRAKALDLAKQGKRNHEIAPLVGMSVAAVQHLTWGARDRSREKAEPAPQPVVISKPIMKREPYTRVTLQRMRDLTALGRTAGDIAAVFNWSLDELLRCAVRHEISLIRTATRTATLPEETELDERSLTAKGKPRRQLLDHPRCCYFTVAISEAARERLLAIAALRKKPIAGIAAIGLDFALRNGAFDTLMLGALEELEVAA